MKYLTLHQIFMYGHIGSLCVQINKISGTGCTQIKTNLNKNKYI